MKKILALFCFCMVMPSVSMADAEIQIFINYRGSAGYDHKVVSDFKNPASADLLYSDDFVTSNNAACYFGNPNEALSLFRLMVDIFNEDNHRGISISTSTFYDATTRNVALTIFQRDERGVVTPWFERMRRCVRHSTPGERMDNGHVNPRPLPPPVNPRPLPPPVKPNPGEDPDKPRPLPPPVRP